MSKLPTINLGANKTPKKHTHQHDSSCNHSSCGCSNQQEPVKLTNQKYSYKLQGLDCANCASKIENYLNKLDYYQNVRIDFMNMRIWLDTSLPENKIIASLQKDINKVEDGVKVVDESTELTKEVDYTIYRIIGALVLFLFGAYFDSDIIILLSYVLAGYDIVWRSIKNIMKGKIFDENFLMSVATIGAILIKDYAEASAVMLFYQIGEYLQRYAVNKSRKSIKDLMDIKPEYANMMINNVLTQVDPSSVNVDDVIIVKPGEKVPLDGVVIDGNGEIDNKALTGESALVEVSKGDNVLSGCINVNGSLVIKVLKTYQNSTVSKILDLVENASSSKAKSENFITKFSRYYTPIVCLLALIIAFVVPLFIPGYPFNDFIIRGLSFLVVSCPCALVISIPLSYFAGIGGLSKNGILVKGSNYIETLAKVKTIVFDKTGTLTKGSFEVLEYSTDETLEYAAILENQSNHPIATSIVKAYKNTIDQNVLNFKEILGKGITGSINDDLIMVGNSRLLDENNIAFTPIETPYTTLYVVKNNQYVGYLILADRIKSNAKEMISTLHSEGVNQLYMLSGDKNAVAKTISNDLGLDGFKAQLLPDQKVDALKEFINKDTKTAFVGDGINDAPSLAIADCGIAMGAIGSDAAIEAADIVLMNDDLMSIPIAIMGARKIQAIATSNIVFAIGIKAIVLILIAMGYVDMWLAIFADVGVSLIAIMNSLRGMKIQK